MGIRHHIIIIFASSLFGACALAQPTQETQLNQAELDDYIEEAMDAWEVPGLAIALIQNDDIIYMKGFGQRDVAKDLPVTPDTLFVGASTSKAFTSFGVGLLVDDGLLSWDDPVRNYVPRFELATETATAEISLRDMLSHRAGLPRHDMLWYGDSTISRSQLIERLKYLPLNAPIRTKWQYNNLLYMTAGYAIEVISGQTWEDFTADRVFAPLGMTRTNFSVSEMLRDDNHAVAYKDNDDKELVAIPTRAVDNIGPAGSINSSVRDYAQWARLLLNKGSLGDTQILSAAQIQTLFTATMPIAGNPEFQEFTAGAYGLGWFIDGYRGLKRVQHGGNLDGFTARITLFPDQEIASVIFVNKEASPLPGFLSLDITDRMLSLEPKDWSKKMLKRRDLGDAATDEAKARKDEMRVLNTTPSHPLTDFQGTYSDPGYGELKVGLTDGSLSADYRGTPLTLHHWHYDIFNSERVQEQDDGFDDLKFNFQTDTNGQISSLAIVMDPLVEAINFKKKADPRLSDPIYLASYTGAYIFLDKEISVALSGSKLTIRNPGQPTFSLAPRPDGTFVLEAVSTVAVRFVEENGEISALQLLQPNGVFEAARKVAD